MTSPRTPGQSFAGNILANFAGRVWSSLLSILAVPVFLYTLGQESFGLVGLFSSLELLFTFLDFGLSATVNREIARSRSTGKPVEHRRNLMRTFESLYWLIGVGIGAALLLLSPYIATHWVRPEKLTRAEIELAVSIMALSVALRWPVSLYAGALKGLEHQVTQNVISALAATLRILGALAAVLWISPTIYTYLIFQAGGNLLEVGLLVLFAWRGLSGGTARPRFDRDILRSIWKFALSFNAVGMIGMVLSQADKLLTSRYLYLHYLSAYSTAGTIAGALTMISYAVVTAVFPRFSGQVAGQQQETLITEFRRSMQVVTCITAPLAILLMVYARPILLAWTRNPEITEIAVVPAVFLVFSSLLNAIQNPAYTLLVAAGQTRVPLIANLVNALIFIPLMVFAIPRAGVNAAAALWTAQNLIWLLVYFWALRRCGAGFNARAILARDVAPYVLLSIAAVFALAVFFPASGEIWPALAGMAGGMAVYALGITAFSRILKIFPHGLWAILGATFGRPRKADV